MSRASLRWLAYGLLQLVRGWLEVVPQSVAQDVAARAAVLGFRLRRQEYRRTLDHLEMAFGDEQTPKQRRALADRFFRHIGRTFVEFCALPRLSPAEIRASVHVEGLDHLEQSLARGRGTVLVTAHVGNWELSGAHLVACGFNTYVIARRIYFEPFSQQIEEIRQANGLKTIYQDQGLRPLLRALRENAVVGLLADQDIPRIPGVFVNFFGKPTYTPSGPFALALSAKAPLVSMFQACQAGGHLLKIGSPIEIKRTGDRDKDVQALAQIWSDRLEAFLRQFPEQWVWHHRRWRTQPQEDGS